MEIIKYKQVIDPTAYPEYLRTNVALMPPGAYEFASDIYHYDFYSDYCIHDLEVKNIEISNENKLSITIHFVRNRFKHIKDLEIKYQNVSTFNINRTDEDEIFLMKFGPVIIDEILVHKKGISHEIQFTNSSIMLVCEDLKANWIE